MEAEVRECEVCLEGKKATHFILGNSFYYVEQGVCCECHEQCLREGWHEGEEK